MSQLAPISEGFYAVRVFPSVPLAVFHCQRVKGEKRVVLTAHDGRTEEIDESCWHRMSKDYVLAANHAEARKKVRQRQYGLGYNPPRF